MKTIHNTDEFAKQAVEETLAQLRVDAANSS